MSAFSWSDPWLWDKESQLKTTFVQLTQQTGTGRKHLQTQAVLIASGSVLRLLHLKIFECCDGDSIYCGTQAVRQMFHFFPFGFEIKHRGKENAAWNLKGEEADLCSGDSCRTLCPAVLAFVARQSFD